MAGKSLDPDEFGRLHAVLRRLRESGMTQVVIAEKAGISQQNVSRAMKPAEEGGGAGYDFARAIARVAGMTSEELLTGRRETTVVRDGDAPTLERVPGYLDAERSARAIAPRIQESVWIRVRTMSGADLGSIDAETVLGFARQWERALSAAPVLRPDQPGDGLRQFPDDGDTPPPTKKRAL
jgi:transcriptional regulator with XRE-family HTH domain